MQLASWKLLGSTLVLCTLVTIYMKHREHEIALSSLPNYLYLGATNLKQHAVSNADPDETSIVFLGSSAVAGSNIPINSSMAHYFQDFSSDHRVYSLGVHQANIVDSLTYYLLSLQYQKPKLVIMGISPEYFPDRWPATRAIGHNLETLKKVLPEDDIKKLEWANSKKLFFIDDWLRGEDVKIPSQGLLAYRTFLYNLRRSFFGPVMEAKLVGKGVHLGNIHPANPTLPLLSLFQKVIQQNGGKLVVFLEPQLQVDRFYQPEEFAKYRKLISDKLTEDQITFYDYINLFPDNAEHFVDFIHLTPEAYQKLAEQLWDDVKKAGVL